MFDIESTFRRLDFFQILPKCFVLCVLSWKTFFFSSRAFRPTRGIVIQKFVCASVRASVRAYDVTNLYKAKFENRDRYGLTFFFNGLV